MSEATSTPWSIKIDPPDPLRDDAEERLMWQGFLDEMIRDMGRAVDIARGAIAKAEGGAT